MTRKYLIALIIGFTLSITLHLWCSVFAEDDAYIHIRAASNLWLTGKPFFNLSAPCLSSSSILWVILLSPSTLLGGKQIAGIAVLNGVLSVLSCALVGKLLRRMYPDMPSSITSLTVALVYCGILPSSLSLMESSFALTLTTLAFLLLFHGNPLWSTLMTALPLVRPELLAVLPLAVGVRCHQKSPIHRATILEWVLPAVVCSLLGYLYISTFGPTLPQSMIAKTIVYQLTPQEFVRSLVTALTGGITNNGLLIAWLATLILLTLVVVSRSNLPSGTAHRAYGPMVISLTISLLVVAGYAVRSVLVFPWYAPLITVPTIIALAPVWRLGLRHQLCMTVLVLPQASAAILSALTPIAPQHSPLAPSGARAHTLLLIGQALSSIEPRLTIVAPEIGALGYGFRGDLIDAVGLASPASLTFHPLRVPEERQGGYQGAVPPQLVKNTQPDVVIGLPSLMNAVSRDPHLTNYTKIEIPITLPPPHDKVPATVWGNSHITVLVQNAKYEEVAQRLLNPLHPL